MAKRKRKKSQGPQKQKHPDLAGLTPTQQLDALPPFPDEYCQKRNKVCQPRSGGCGHRYKKGDKTWVCPECGFDRRCVGTKVKGRVSCRMHGGAKGSGGVPKSMKYMPPQVIIDNYNRMFPDKELLTLGHEIAILSSYTQQLFESLEESNVTAAHFGIQAAAEIIEDGVRNMNMLRVRQGLQKLQDSMDPVMLTFLTWKEIKDNFNLQTSMADKQNNWLMKKETMMPREEVLEVLIWMGRIGLKHIKTSEDRQSYGREIMSLLPRMEAETDKRR